eukprot:scaffold2637_cov107-Isochrysis_galbana.AAC.2
MELLRRRAGMDVLELAGLFEGVVGRGGAAVGVVPALAGEAEAPVGGAGLGVADAPMGLGAGRGQETGDAAGGEGDDRHGKDAGKRARGLCSLGDCGGAPTETGELGLAGGPPRVGAGDGHAATGSSLGVSADLISPPLAAGCNLRAEGEWVADPPLPSSGSPTAGDEDGWAAETVRVAAELHTELGRMFASAFPEEPRLPELCGCVADSANV